MVVHEIHVAKKRDSARRELSRRGTQSTDEWITSGSLITGSERRFGFRWLGQAARSGYANPKSGRAGPFDM